MIGHTYERRQAIDDRVKEITRDLAAINASNANILKQIAAKEAEKQRYARVLSSGNAGVSVSKISGLVLGGAGTTFKTTRSYGDGR